jgi:hypothetical protein
MQNFIQLEICNHPARKKISVNLPSAFETVNPETILIGNPASNQLKSWIPDTGIRG